MVGDQVAQAPDVIAPIPVQLTGLLDMAADADRCISVPIFLRRAISFSLGSVLANEPGWTAPSGT